ncbi:hypothetical protein FE257_003056 [Aspergillus nanangensis]|uniref:CENP-V/GFA domain-containing protein n=1 Tax=Aspergillus nanangensis TaxID=2582783 RepID=A0AAD4CCC2_ASPNN|nr:hypothetical protein FE257_003056 [Aspergillus nanangensis]
MSSPPHLGKFINPNSHPVSEFANGLSGTCLCGSINVTINDPELFSRPRGHICHCANCRKVAGSYAASNLIIEEDKVAIEDRQGTLKVFVDTQTGSGNPLQRYFCSQCGNPIKSVTPLRKGWVIVKMGIFPRIPNPEFESFALHKHDWEDVPKGVTQFKIALGGERV